MIRLLRESFIPVLLVIAGIFLLVFYSNYIADIDADQVTVIEIPATSIQQTEDAEYDVDEESFSQVELLRVDDPVYKDASLLIRSKQWQQAEQAYLELIDKHDSSQARTDLGFIYYKQTAYEKAATQFVEALNKEPIYIAAYFYRAKTWRKMDNYAAAAADYLAYIRHFSTHYSAHFNLGMVRLKQKKYQLAVQSFENASQLAPGRKKSKALYFLGKSYQKMGESYFAQATEAYQRSIRISPANIKPRMGLASLLPDNELGWTEAEEIYQQVLQLKPNYSQAYFLLANIYNNQARQREVIAAYQKTIEFNPSYITARYKLGLLLLEKEKWREAADQFNAIVNLDPSRARAHFNLGRANYRLKYYDQALMNYQTALRLRDGDYPEVAINLGLIYSAKKDYAKAIEIYNAALKKNRRSASLHYNIGIAYSKSDNNSRALDEFNKAISYRPDYAQAWYNIGLILSRSKKHSRAIDAYRKALEIKPDYRSALLNLAVSLTRTNELKQAELIYRQVLEDNPRYASAWINLGLVLVEQELFSEAEEVLTQASLLESDNHRVIGILAKTQAKQAKYSDAIENYRIALDMNPNSKKYRLEYIRALKLQGELELALVEVEKAIKLYPKSRLLKKEYKQIQFNLNNVNEG